MFVFYILYILINKNTKNIDEAFVNTEHYIDINL